MRYTSFGGKPTHLFRLKVATEYEDERGLFHAVDDIFVRVRQAPKEHGKNAEDLAEYPLEEVPETFKGRKNKNTGDTCRT